MNRRGFAFYARRVLQPAFGIQTLPRSYTWVEPATLKDPARRFEHYELVTGEDGKPVELGRGAMGVTYKAFDVDLRCPVTLKVISERYLGDESAQLRFLREARAAARRSAVPSASPRKASGLWIRAIFMVSTESDQSPSRTTNKVT